MSRTRLAIGIVLGMIVGGLLVHVGQKPVLLAFGQQTSGAVLVGSQNWVPTGVIPNPPDVVTGSSFLGTTQGGPLLIQLVIPLYGPGPGWGAACQPIVDGAWAGAVEFPNLANSLVAEGSLFTVSNSAASGVWSTARTYNGIDAGDHVFAALCGATFVPPSFGAYWGGSSPDALASLTVLEFPPSDLTTRVGPAHLSAGASKALEIKRRPSPRL